ncbi:hypothetical protein RclHR1_00150063 [Rhizophagus clarus]|uniref:Translation machinery-associated protein 16 n=1 Tax=Rhizophagus clarus TaxID=94130 RepID=A0A2Z6QE22_9GLOM|nr:hypothetical protein RclHR1_00150063 [Rhizophagus clarus]GES84768.1 translation machinery-associated protein 16 [Rhizophagus clarus]
MPNNKRHTLKQIKNKESIIHPSSRKAAQLQRISLRKDRLEKGKSRRVSERVQPIVERLLWFRYAFDDKLPCATKAEAYGLIEMYITRNDDEIKNLISLRKVNSSRYFYLESLKLKEKKEYIEGFEIPDLMNPKNVKLLRQWDGDVNSISRIKIIRIEDPNNVNNLKTTAQILEEKRKLNEKFNQNSLENIMDDFKMGLEEMNINNEQSNIEEIVNYNLLDDIKEKLII